jgi:hypothetical protein
MIQGHPVSQAEQRERCIQQNNNISSDDLNSKVEMRENGMPWGFQTAYCWPSIK